MNKVTLDIEKEYKCDVLVCGGGVSGFSAAVSAAELGAEVILLDSGGCLGGTATKGLVGPFMTCYDSKGEKRIIKGLFERLEKRLIEKGGAISPSKCRGGDSFSGYRTAGHIGVMPFEVEALKRETEAMCLEAGVKLLYHTVMIGSEAENGNITKVYAADQNRIISISAKMFIDTTGYASLAKAAGAETMRGNDDGVMQTASTFFTISGVNKEKLDEYMAENEEMRSRFFMDEIEEGRKRGEFPCGTNKLRIFEGIGGEWFVNMAQIDEQINELDTEEITMAEAEQRKQIAEIVEFLRKTIPGLEDIKLVQTASEIGIRESRRIVGHTVFTLEHMKNSYKFPDRIAVCANSVDIHQKNGVNYTAAKGENYYIPLSCLISKDIDNLLTAGKSLSADRFAFAAVRVMPPCMAMGEAVGICAAIAAKEGIRPFDVDYKEIQAILTKRGAYLE